MRAPRRMSRPTRGRRTTGTKSNASRMLPPGMDIPKSTTTRGGEPIGGKVGTLKDVMERYRKEVKKKRAGKARSTPTPKAPTRTTRPTPATPKRGTPPTSSRPRRPLRVAKPGTRRPTGTRTSVNTGRPPRRMGRR